MTVPHERQAWMSKAIGAWPDEASSLDEVIDQAVEDIADAINRFSIAGADAFDETAAREWAVHEIEVRLSEQVADEIGGELKFYLDNSDGVDSA